MIKGNKWRGYSKLALKEKSLSYETTHYWKREIERCNWFLQNNEGLAGVESEKFAKDHKTIPFRSLVTEEVRSGRYVFLFFSLLSYPNILPRQLQLQEHNCKMIIFFFSKHNISVEGKHLIWKLVFLHRYLPICIYKSHIISPYLLLYCIQLLDRKHGILDRTTFIISAIHFHWLSAFF